MVEFPKVSIALCTYNGERFLKEQLDTLINQTYSNLEIIAVDDCSNDNTVAILTSYAYKYTFLKVFLNAANLGFTKNFEKAISLCSGDYIALCDQDDIWSPEKINELIKYSQGKVLVYHDSKLIDAEGKDIGKKISDRFNMFQGNDPRPLLFFNCISGHSMLFEKRIISEIIPIKFVGFHDWWIAYIAANMGSIGYIDKCLVNYRQHEESVSDVMNLKKTKKPNDWTFKQWLVLCASYEKNRYPVFVRNAYNLYFSNRNKKGISFERLFFLLRNRGLLLGLQKKSQLSKINFILKQL